MTDTVTFEDMLQIADQLNEGDTVEIDVKVCTDAIHDRYESQTWTGTVRKAERKESDYGNRRYSVFLNGDDVSYGRIRDGEPNNIDSAFLYEGEMSQRSHQSKVGKVIAIKQVLEA